MLRDFFLWGFKNMQLLKIILKGVKTGISEQF